jgi:hypothetical protein
MYDIGDGGWFVYDFISDGLSFIHDVGNGASLL